MSEKLFREKSLKKVTSPEELNDYVKVANPGIWLLLVGVIILLVGVFVWSVYGKMDTVIQTLGVVENNKIVVYIKESDINEIDASTVFKLNDKEFEVTKKSNSPIRVDENFSEYMLHVGELSENEWVYPIEGSIAIADGVYPVSVVIESISPISFVIN